ncbi:MAG: aldehyde dehydrogenase family protein [Planctomycetaceae bacterium]
MVGGERVQQDVPANGIYVRPAIIEIDSQAEIVKQETFAPLLYVMRYESLNDAIEIQSVSRQFTVLSPE